MEAPVPASALIHSATLVSAGVYLILRFKAVLLLSEYATTVLPFIGAFTACLGAISSAFQTDAKRLLAYSTISHCGFLVVSAIMCDSEYTVFYLYVHGFFKAASFICVGNVIRFNTGCQDIRVMGGYAKFLPFECLSLFVCLLFLAGAPFTLGFFMKHFLIAAIPTNTFFFKSVNALLFTAACLGVVYCSKLYYGIFFGVKKSNKFVYINTMRMRYYRYDTDSTFFTITTIGAAIAIYFLIIFGVIISLIFLLIIFNKIFNTPDFGTSIY
jgi:NADH-quinone oxidoreductase subunit L